jgi:hypothetical protein
MDRKKLLIENLCGLCLGSSDVLTLERICNGCLATLILVCRIDARRTAIYRWLSKEPPASGERNAWVVRETRCRQGHSLSKSTDSNSWRVRIGANVQGRWSQ